MPSLRPSRLKSSDSGNGLKSKELNRLLQLSKGSFILGNKHSKTKSSSSSSSLDDRMNPSSSSTKEHTMVATSVSQLLSSSRDKRRSRRHSIENESSTMSSSSTVTSELMEKRGRDILNKNKPKNRRSGSRSRSKSSVRSSSKDDGTKSRKNRRSSRSRSRVRPASTSNDEHGSMSFTADSLGDNDVNIAAAKSLALRRSNSASQMSLSGKSKSSNSGGRSRRSKSALKTRHQNHRYDDSSSIGDHSALSSQLSMISNLEELSALDATVLSASESDQRVKYSRRSSRSTSRPKGSQSQSHRRRKNSSGNASVAGSVYSTDSKSVQDILSELKSTASTPTYIRYASTGRSARKKKHSNNNNNNNNNNSVDQSETLMELLRQSRDVLKEASDFRLSRTSTQSASQSQLQPQPQPQSTSSSPTHETVSTSFSSLSTSTSTPTKLTLNKPALLGRSKSDTPTSSKDHISITRPSPISAHTSSTSSLTLTSLSTPTSMNRPNLHPKQTTDLISRAEHSFLDDLVKSVDPTDAAVSQKASTSNSSSPNISVKHRISLFEKKTDIPNETKPNTTTSTTTTTTNFSPEWENDFESTSSPSSWNHSKKAFLTNNAIVPNSERRTEEAVFENDASFTHSICDSTLSESNDMPPSDPSIEKENQKEDDTSDEDDHVLDHSNTDATSASSQKEEEASKDAPKIDTANDETSQTIPSSKEESSKKTDNDGFESFTTVFDPWPDDTSAKQTTEPLNTSDPFSLGSSFHDDWNTSQDLTSDSFDPFPAAEEQEQTFSPDPDRTFLHHDDSRNVSVLSYSKGESMVDFFGDMTLDDFATGSKSPFKPAVSNHSTNHIQTHTHNDAEDDEEGSDDDSFKPIFADQSTIAEFNGFELNNTTSSEDDVDLQLSPTDEFENDFVVSPADDTSSTNIDNDDDDDNDNALFPPSSHLHFPPTFGKIQSIGSIDPVKEEGSLTSEQDDTHSIHKHEHPPTTVSKNTRTVQFADSVTSKEIPSRADQNEFTTTFTGDWGEPSFEDEHDHDQHVEEKANFMMGFMSDFPNNSFEAWDSTDNIDFVGDFKTNDDTFNDLQGGKRLSFGSAAEDDDETNPTPIQNNTSFNPFGTANNNANTNTNAFSQSEPKEDAFFADFHDFSTTAPIQSSPTTLFPEKVTFEESFGSTNFFDAASDAPRKSRPKQTQTSKSKSNPSWDTNDEKVVTFFDPWFNDNWETKRDSSGRESGNAAASITDFSTGTADSPSSVIPQDRFFVK